MTQTLPPNQKTPIRRSVPPPVARTANRVRREPQNVNPTDTDWDLARVMLIANQRPHAPLQDIGPTLWCVYTEAAALGALIIDPLNRLGQREEVAARDNTAHLRVLECGLNRLTPGHFHGAQNRVTFEAIRALWARRHFDESAPLFIDTILVGQQLRRAGTWNDGYSAAYLTALLEACPAPSNIGRYCDELERLRQLRELRYLHEELGRVLDPAYEPTAIIAAVRTALESIEHGGTRVTTDDGKPRLRGLLENL